MEAMVQIRTAMIFSAEFMAQSVHVGTLLRHDKAITICISSSAPDTEIISEAHVTISNVAARELAKKLIKRLSEIHEW